MKLRLACRKVRDYIRYDLKEIAFPSALPNPPGTVKKRKFEKITLYQWCLVFKQACRIYCKSFKHDIGPDLRPHEYKKDEESKDKPGGDESTAKKKEPSTLVHLAVAARGGMETLRPALQRVYMTKASAYRDALQSFVMGYQEGIKEVIEKQEDLFSSKKQEDSNSEHKTDIPGKGTA